MTIGTPFKGARKLAYLNAEGTDKPLISPVPDVILGRGRHWRLGRLREMMDQHDVAGLLLTVLIWGYGPRIAPSDMR